MSDFDFDFPTIDLSNLVLGPSTRWEKFKHWLFGWIRPPKCIRCEKPIVTKNFPQIVLKCSDGMLKLPICEQCLDVIEEEETSE